MAKTPTERTLEWRKRNPEKYRAYMREYMKRKRPSQKTEKKPLTNTTNSVTNTKSSEDTELLKRLENPQYRKGTRL